MKAVLGYLLGIFVLCHITKVQLFLCDKGLDYNSFECHSGMCCIPEGKVVKLQTVSYWIWPCSLWLGSHRMSVKSPNKTCVTVSGRCKVTLSYCYIKDTPSSSTTTVATLSSSTRLDNVSNSPITFENTSTSMHTAVASGVNESTEMNCSSSMPETGEVKVSAVGVIVGVSIAVLVLTIFGVVILLVIRIRRKRTQKRTTDASKRAITFSNRGYNTNGEYENSHEGIATIRLPTLASNCVSTNITYSAVEKETRTKVTEQIPILEFRNYSNYRNVQCADSNEENAYDSTDHQTNHAVIDDTYDHTVSIVNNHAVIDDTYDHAVSTVNSHAVIEDTYDHTVSIVNNHAVIEDT